MTSEQRQETRDVHASGPAPAEYSVGVDCDDETRTKTVDRARAVEESAGQEGESQDILRLPRAV